jgi:hypothetical protein
VLLRSVPPQVNPDGTQPSPRSPLIIVSPYARAGYTDTTATTSAGTLAYTEHDLVYRQCEAPPQSASDSYAVIRTASDTGPYLR